jgi:hypothetical protein
MRAAAPMKDKNKKNISISMRTLENSRKIVEDTQVNYSVKKWKLSLSFKTQECTSKLLTEVQSWMKQTYAHIYVYYLDNGAAVGTEQNLE